MANTEHPVSIRVPEDLLAEVDAIAVAEKRSRSFLILEAVREKYGSRTADGMDRVAGKSSGAWFRNIAQGKSDELFCGSGKCPHDYINWMVCPKCNPQEEK